MKYLLTKLTFVCCVGAVCAMTSSVIADQIYTSGHADIGIGFEGGELEPHWHVEGGIVDGVPRPDEEFEPADLRAVTSISFERPVGSDWNPIGNSAGDSVWFLPQSNTSGTPFLGLATGELDPGDWTTPMTWAVTSVSGPGQFSLWQNGVTSPIFFVSSVDGLDSSDEFMTSIGGHDHFNYGFTALGTYEVTFEVSATHMTAGAQTNSGVFRFTAVPEPGSFAALASFGVFGLLVRRRKPPATRTGLVNRS